MAQCAKARKKGDARPSSGDGWPSSSVRGVARTSSRADCTGPITVIPRSFATSETAASPLARSRSVTQWIRHHDPRELEEIGPSVEPRPVSRLIRPRTEGRAGRGAARTPRRPASSRTCGTRFRESSDRRSAIHEDHMVTRERTALVSPISRIVQSATKCAGPARSGGPQVAEVAARSPASGLLGRRTERPHDLLI